MTTYAEVKLKHQIKDNGFVELTIVDENDKVTEEKHTNFDEAKQAIESYENDCTVYF